jgi:sugar phosphate isomerase/epimerase
MSEGLYDISKMLRQLQRMSYQGFISLEDLGGADARGAITPEEKAAEGIEYLKHMTTLTSASL